jgi:hypothetical protein
VDFRHHVANYGGSHFLTENLGFFWLEDHRSGGQSESFHHDSPAPRPSDGLLKSAVILRRPG